MKKLLVLLVCFIVCLCSLFMTSCSNNQNEANNAEFANYEIGDEIFVYPDCEFDYVFTIDNTEYTAHVSDIKCTLIEKNTISPGDTLTKHFYPYMVSIQVTATTDQALSGKILSITFTRINETSRFGGESKVQPNGQINWNFKRQFTSLNDIRFCCIW